MIDYNKELNPEQLKVVEHGDGPCLVLAGAGSGKTRTITYRVAYLLEQGVKPDEILLVTFTNKAAREMVSRVETLVAATDATRRHVGASLPWSGTFHHIAFRILKLYAPLLGYKHNFTVLDSEDSKDLLKLCLKQEGVDRTERRFPSPAVLSSMISYARNAERSLSELIGERHPKWFDLADTIGRIAENYAKRKKEANAMDFDDLLVNLYRLFLTSDEARGKYATQFRYILVDEYQDTNRIQASTIRLLSSVHHNVVVVGDDAQSIYSFRAADIQNILDFERDYPEAKIFRLETNYRSTPDILDLANDVILQNKNQYQKELKSVRDRFAKPEVHAFADSPEEAEFIAERVLELREEGVPLSRMAVLFRAAFHSQALEIELTKRDIPYDYRGGVRFFERAHVKDVIGYLRICHNRNDVIAWSRILNMQTGIGPASAERVIGAIQKMGEEEDISELRSLLTVRGRLGWGEFLQIWNKLRASDGLPAGLIRSLLKSKYVDYLELQYPDYRERVQDIEQLALFAERESDLTKFLAEASLQEGYGVASSRGSSASDDDDEKVVLSTIHQAKGLEWDAVFILNVSAGQFPNERALGEERGLEEERRLFYVAITRAKKYLYLTYPLTGNTNSYLQGPSMFLSEIERDLVTETMLGRGTVFSDLNDKSDEIEYVSEDEPFPSRNPKRSFLKSVDDL